MTEAESESADADTDEEDFTYHKQITQHAHTAIEGNVTEVITGSRLDSTVESTGTNFAAIVEDPAVVKGTVWRNRNIPDGFTSTSELNDAIQLAAADPSEDEYVRATEVTEEAVENARSRLEDYVESHDSFEIGDWDEMAQRDEQGGLRGGVSGSDYKVADPSDHNTEVQEIDGKTLGIDVGGGTFSAEKEDSLPDTIMVWYSGMVGQFFGRAMDFNGLPFARYNQDGELRHGLLQVPIGWRGDADRAQFDSVPTTDRKKLSTDLGRPPRIGRPLILRDDLDRVTIEIGRYNGGDMNEITMFRAIDDYDGYFDGDVDVDEISMTSSDNTAERIAEEFDSVEDAYSLYHGDGWQDKPDGATTDVSGGGGGSFDVDVQTDSGGLSDDEKQFAEMVSEQITGHDASPDDDIFPVDGTKTDIEGLVAANEDEFDGTPDVAAIREKVFELTPHLDGDDA